MDWENFKISISFAKPLTNERLPFIKSMAVFRFREKKNALLKKTVIVIIKR